MKSILAAAVLTLSSVTSFAQSSAWSLVNVEGVDKNTVGYIYHVYAIGTATIDGVNSPATAGLRFVCSTKSASPTPPIVAIFWNGTTQSGPTQDVLMEINKVARITTNWIHDGSVLYMPMDKDPSILIALKQGKSVRFSWSANERAKYTVIFSLKNFDLSSFNSLCKSNL